MERFLLLKCGSINYIDGLCQEQLSDDGYFTVLEISALKGNKVLFLSLSLSICTFLQVRKYIKKCHSLYILCSSVN